MKQIIKTIKRFLEWVRFLLWIRPTSEPPKEDPIRVMGEQVFKDYMVIIYHKQKINLRISEYPAWKANSRYDKRATAKKFADMERKGLIRFEIIEDKWICIKNLDYESRIKK